MNLFKKSSTFIYTIILVGLGIIFSFYFWYEKKFEQNVLNCEKVKVGMALNSVTSIMGQPDEKELIPVVINNQQVALLRCSYGAPSEALTGVWVFLDPNTKVVVYLECR